MDTFKIKNRPLNELEKEDKFNTLSKANAICNFIETRINELNQNNMIALYGEWGCGKSTVLKHIFNKLSETKNNDNINIFTPIFFEAWRYEKDNILAVSLFDCIIDKTDKPAKEECVGVISKTIRSIAYSSSFNFGIMNFESSKAIDREKYLSEIKSTYSLEKELQKNFAELLTKHKKQIIVLIDDLDRCQPENTVNLLSDIKLFFTLGQLTANESFNTNIVFICAIDKKAVVQAVNIRYNDYVKAEEYLEKIFDFTFNMPRLPNIKTFIESIFKEKSQIHWISLFLKEIKFTNPRHLIKVFNKFHYLKKLNIKNIPEIDNPENELLTIMILFLIILHEFYRNSYIEIRNYDLKEDKFYIEGINGEENTKNYSIDLIYTCMLFKFKYLSRREITDSLDFKIHGKISLLDANTKLYSLDTKNIVALQTLTILLPNVKWVFLHKESIYYNLNNMKTDCEVDKHPSIDFCLFLGSFSKDISLDINHDCNFIKLLNVIEDYL